MAGGFYFSSKTTMKTLELPDKKWLRGTSGGELLNYSGRMCCLGVYESTKGIPDDLLRNVETPTSLRNSLEDEWERNEVADAHLDTIREIADEWAQDAPLELRTLISDRLQAAADAENDGLDSYGVGRKKYEHLKKPHDEYSFEDLAVAVNDCPHIDDKVRVFLLNKIFPPACGMNVRFRED